MQICVQIHQRKTLIEHSESAECYQLKKENSIIDIFFMPKLFQLNEFLKVKRILVNFQNISVVYLEFLLLKLHFVLPVLSVKK